MKKSELIAASALALIVSMPAYAQAPTQGAAPTQDDSITAAARNDAGETIPSDTDLPSITDWMSVKLARAERKFVGRLLPADRPHRAQALVDGRPSTFGG